MINLLEHWACERGYRIACGDIGILQEVRCELHSRKNMGELDSSFAENYLASFRYEQSAEKIGTPQALLVIAVPRPAHRVKFATRAGPIEVILPPTYLRYRAFFTEVCDDLTSAIPQMRGHLEILLAPLKALACRLGLASYGRNNLAYITEWGSYFQLVGYISDLDLGSAGYARSHLPELMADCEACGICTSACPTGAISEERTLLHAENCTTLFSEEPGELAHNLYANCLFGCLVCQDMCPVNAGRLQIESAGVSFTVEETEAILAGRMAGGEVETSAAHKLAVLGLSEEGLVGRNLAHLVARGVRIQ